MTISNESAETILELKKISKLLALIAIENKTQSEKIFFLDQLGYSGPQIGQLLSITPNAVRLALFHARKKGGK